MALVGKGIRRVDPRAGPLRFSVVSRGGRQRAVYKRWSLAMVGLALLAAATASDAAFPPNEEVAYARAVPYLLRGSALVLFMPYLLGLRRPVILKPLNRWLAAWATIVVASCALSLPLTPEQFLMAARWLFWVVLLVAFQGAIGKGALPYPYVVRVLAVAVCIVSVRQVVYVASGTWLGASSAETWAAARNSGYTVLFLLPLLLPAVKGSVVIRAISVAAVLSVVICLKRGALIALVVALVGYGLTAMKMNTRGLSTRALVGGVAVGGTLIAALWIAWDPLYERFLENVGTEKAGSGRMLIYSSVMEAWRAQPFKYQLLGNGFDGVADVTSGALGMRVAAHSDWLEVLYDQGLVGIVVLVGLMSGFWRQVAWSWRCRDGWTATLVASTVILALRSTYSMGLGELDTVWFSLVVAYSMSSVQRSSAGTIHGRSLPPAANGRLTGVRLPISGPFCQADRSRWQQTDDCNPPSKTVRMRRGAT